MQTSTIVLASEPCDACGEPNTSVLPLASGGFHVCRAIFLDLFGAALDSDAVWMQAAGDAARGAAWRREAELLAADCCRRGISRDFEDLIREASRSAGVDTAGTDRFLWLAADMKPFAERVDEVDAARREAAVIAVANAPLAFAEKALERSGFAFDALAAADEAGAYAPDPALFERELARLGLAPHEAVAAVRTEALLEAAAAAGIEAVWLSPADDRPEGWRGRIRWAKSFEALSIEIEAMDAKTMARTARSVARSSAR